MSKNKDNTASTTPTNNNIPKTPKDGTSQLIQLDNENIVRYFNELLPYLSKNEIIHWPLTNKNIYEKFHKIFPRKISSKSI